MIITRNYLAQYLDLNDVTDQDLSSAFNNLGFEVEKVFNLYKSNKNIILGKIISKTNISKTSLMNFCLVDIGNELDIKIISSSNNFNVGDFVIVALENSILASYNNKIEKTKYNDKYISEGILCTLSDLGINPMSSEVFVFNQKFNYHVGDKNPLRYIIDKDTSFELGLTYNRSDCYSAYQLVKEIAAYFKLSLKTLDLSFNEKLINKSLNPKFKITDDKLVESSKGIIIKNINNKISPQWLKSILIQLGIQSTNVVNDLINYVSWEIGKPLVVFNLLEIKDQLVLTNNSKINKELKQTNDDLVIVDNDKVVEVCGVTIADNYKVTSDTKDIILLCNTYNQNLIIKQQKKYMLNNIIMQRYTKNLSNNKIEQAIKRFLHLLTLITTYDEHSVIIEFKNKVADKITIQTTLEYQSNILGISNLTIERIKELLSPLDFQIIGKKNEIIINVPEERLDVINQANISEEIARMYGYNNIPSLPPISEHQQVRFNHFQLRVDAVRELLLSYGIYETKTYSLVSELEYNKFNFFNYKKSIKIENPLSGLHSHYRLNLVSSLLNVIKYNSDRNIYNFNIFEMSNIYYDLEKSNYHLVIVLQNNFLINKFTKQEIKIDFYTTKGLLVAILSKFNLKIEKLELSNDELLHPYLQSNVFIKNKQVATFGKVNDNFKNDIFIIDINLSQVEKNWQKKVNFIGWSNFNSSTFDFSFYINSEVTFEKIQQTIFEIDQRIKKIVITDHYVINDQEQSLTISITINDDQKQLVKDDITLLYNKIENCLKKLNLKFRD